MRKGVFLFLGLFLVLVLMTQISFVVGDDECVGVASSWTVLDEEDCAGVTEYGTALNTDSCVCTPTNTDNNRCIACDDYDGFNYITVCNKTLDSCACGNGVCNPTYGETCSTCADCGACCTPESNATFCTRLGRTCGSVTANDNCNITRTVSSCGTCSAGFSCSSGTCVVSTKLNITYWADMMGNKINETDNGDSVLMIYGGYLLTNKTINYTVQEFNGSSVWWNPFSWSSRSWNTANRISSESAYEPWIISNTDKKRFNVTTAGASNISGNLTVRSNNNNQTIINGVAPSDGAIYSVGYNIWFNQSSTDQDDLLKITWDFGDGTNAIFYNYSSYINSTSANTRHNYSQPGIYTWKISAKGMTRGDEVSVTRNVHILREGINVIPIITSPINGAAYGARWVQFNASQTYVANCTSGIMSGPTFRTVDGLLNCSFLHASGATQTTSAYNLTFSWNLGDGNSIFGDLDANYSQAVVFRYRYSTSGRHVVNLNVRYTE